MVRHSVIRVPARLAVLAGSLAALAGIQGCCLTSVSGFSGETTGAGAGSSGTTGSSGRSSVATGTTAGAATGSTTATATGRATAETATGTATGTTGGSSGGSSVTTGSSTGFPLVTLLPTLLIDAGANDVFGPVAITAVPDSGFGAAKLTYSIGDGGQYGVMVQALAGDGSPEGASSLIAVTGLKVDLAAFETAAPPSLTISDDGAQTTVCWEDFGSTTNLDGGCDPQSDPQNLVLCAALPESGGTGDASYSNCGDTPRLVMTPGDGTTQLFFLPSVIEPSPYAIEAWQVGQSWQVGEGKD